jgi:PAS domain S-box-containing protein
MKKLRQRLAEEKEIVAKIGRIISSSLEIEKVYELFANEVGKVIPFDRIAINIIYPERGTYASAYVAGDDISGRRSRDVVPLAGSCTGEVVCARLSQLIQDDDTDKVVRRIPGLLPAFQAGFRSIMGIPLISKDQVIGVLNFSSFKPKAYAAADVSLAESIGSQIAGAIANAQLYIEQKRTEEELKRSERRYRSLVEDINDGYFIVQDGKFVYVNQAFADLLGHVRKVILRREFSRFFPQEYLQGLSEDGLKGKQDRKHIGEGEFEISRKDGKNLVLEIRSSVIDYNGRSAIAGICKDITERKTAEMALRKKVEELEKWYKVTVDREVEMARLKKRIRQLESKS